MTAPERYDLRRIREYWTRQATQFGEDVAASWSDRSAVELEIEAVLARIADGDTVLDVGCANGFSTLRIAAERSASIRGLDYIPEMIEQARRAHERVRDGLRGRVEFAVGDILALPEPDESYDKVVCVRVLINLGDWDHQRAALAECRRVLRPGGTLLLSEATLQGWRRLNAMRREWDLEEIPMPPFNLYLDQDALIAEVESQFEVAEISDFASTYFVGTRILKPLLIRALRLDRDPADPTMEWNRWLASLPAWGDYGTQKLFVLRKR